MSDEREQFPSDPYTDPNTPPEPAGMPSNFVSWDEGVDPREAAFVAETVANESAQAAVGPDEPVAEALESIYANRETGHLIRIVDENESYVTYAALDGSSKYAMPRADYERDFERLWRRAEFRDLVTAPYLNRQT